ncbi:MAG: FG-GAP repeat domain-containing protein [Promethearchaeota archaeon]
MKKISKIKFFLIFFCIIALVPFISFETVTNSQDYSPIYKGNLRLSAGTWGSVINKSIIGAPTDIFIEDVNNDGLNEIITNNENDNNITILLWNAPSSDWDVIYLDAEGFIQRFFVGDANNDGFNDIVIPDNRIFLWNDTSSDWDGAIFKSAGGAFPYDISIGDANADGYNDILTSVANAFSIMAWNDSSGDWDTPIIHPTGGEPEEIYLGDANNDGFNDIISTSVYVIDFNITVDVWNNNLKDWDTQFILNAGDNLFDVVVEDVNNDGKNDIIACNGFQDTLSILLWNDTASYWNDRITLSIGDTPIYPDETPIDVIVEDVNNDNLNDIVCANFDSDTVSIFLWNDVVGNWENEITIYVEDEPFGIYIGDANNDGYNDIATANYNSASVSIILWHENPTVIPGYEIYFFLMVISIISIISIINFKRKSNKI